jgi:hypothetical protein
VHPKDESLICIFFAARNPAKENNLRMKKLNEIQIALGSHRNHP